MGSVIIIIRTTNYLSCHPLKVRRTIDTARVEVNNPMSSRRDVCLPSRGVNTIYLLHSRRGRRSRRRGRSRRSSLERRMTPSTAGAESGSIGETTRTPTVTPGASFCGTVLPLAGSKDPLLLAIDPLRERASNFALGVELSSVHGGERVLRT